MHTRGWLGGSSPVRTSKLMLWCSSIKKAAPLQTPKPVFAVKFIHKEFAVRHGRLTKKQLDLEINLHQRLGQHRNIVQFFQAGEDFTWRWIAMELAEGGDLFDKIESDVGVLHAACHCCGLYALQRRGSPGPQT